MSRFLPTITFAVFAVLAGAIVVAHAAKKPAPALKGTATSGFAILPHFVPVCKTGTLLYRVKGGLATAVCAKNVIEFKK